jgi:SAM-dependent methyltransferase
MPLDRHLVDAFGSAAPEHFRWQTEAPVVAEAERALVEAAFLPLGRRILDLGCAEGATLRHLGDPAGAVGLDLFAAKLAFARGQVRAHLVAGSANALPFAGGRFDQVLVRDVIHHVPDAEGLLAECRRVLTPGGRIDLLEPCRYNPLILVHALAQPAERGELRSSPGYLARLVGRHFRRCTVTHHQPLPLHRVVFHPHFGSLAAARRAWLRRAVAAAERLAGVLMPKVAWAYIHVRGEDAR